MDAMMGTEKALKVAVSTDMWWVLISVGRKVYYWAALKVPSTAASMGVLVVDLKDDPKAVALALTPVVSKVVSKAVILAGASDFVMAEMRASKTV
jgi:hypothetical protein